MSKRYLPKLEGLLKIEKYDLPHPNWHIIGSPQELPRDAWTLAPVGWTVRCCPRHTYEFRLPSRHYLQYASVRKTIREFQSRLSTQVFWVVYPSWKFQCSGTCMVTPGRLRIEAMGGPLAPLLLGRKSPDASFDYDTFGRPRLVATSGRTDLLSSDDLHSIVEICARISTEREIVLEWSKAVTGGLLFHDWLETV